jgi:hypothetical protein
MKIVTINEIIDKCPECEPTLKNHAYLIFSRRYKTEFGWAWCPRCDIRYEFVKKRSELHD